MAFSAKTELKHASRSQVPGPSGGKSFSFCRNEGPAKGPGYGLHVLASFLPKRSLFGEKDALLFTF